ncbi:DUF2459 domain-containing protein [Roseicella frigidaeris]|nr:DUF2459 domain-containing protein [Roseicella frigidaeris]
MGRRKALALLTPLALGALAGCSRPPPRCPAGAATETEAWVVSHGWHLELALRRTALRGRLARLAAAFPGADALAFGFGKYGFMLAGNGAFEEWLLGPIPGDGVIQVTGLLVPPPEAYPGRVLALALPPGGREGLVRFLADSFAWDAEDRLIPAREEALMGSFFYRAARGYSLIYTCNRWAAEGLQAAGLPVRPEGALFAGAVLDQLAPIACAADPPQPRLAGLRWEDAAATARPRLPGPRGDPASQGG